MNKIKLNDYLAAFLKAQEITHVFEVAGGMITHLLDAIHRLNYTKLISMHHEQSCAFAAEAYGRMTGLPGVAFATSGPGATNLLTGIASCYFDSSPTVFITGQVNLHEQKNDLNIRQLGFQETDIISMAKPIVKKCYSVTSAEAFPQILMEAFETAISFRPGPVLIDLPMNLQTQLIAYQEIKKIQRKQFDSHNLQQDINMMKDKLLLAKRPLILAGGGIRCAQAKEQFHDFVNMTGIPVISSLMGIDNVIANQDLAVGMIGSYGNRWANLAIGLSDLIIVIGSRLDIRQTGADVVSFSNAKTIIHIDCEAGEINNRVKNCLPIIADIKVFLDLAISTFESAPKHDLKKWYQEIDVLKMKWPDQDELKNCKGINPNMFMQQLSKCPYPHAGYVVDVGNHQMWAAQSIRMKLGQFFMTTGGMGAMGFALPAAIGACLTLEKKPLVVIVGDGAMQMNIQELQTIVRNHLPIKIMILNNQALGMIRQFQDSYFEGRYQSTYLGYDSPDFEKIAHAYGIPAKTAFHSDEIDACLDWMLKIDDSPVVLQVMIDFKTNVYPKIAFGKPIYEMEPFAQPISIEST